MCSKLFRHNLLRSNSKALSFSRSKVAMLLQRSHSQRMTDAAYLVQVYLQCSWPGHDKAHEQLAGNLHQLSPLAQRRTGACATATCIISAHHLYGCLDPPCICCYYGLDYQQQQPQQNGNEEHPVQAETLASTSVLGMPKKSVEQHRCTEEVSWIV